MPEGEYPAAASGKDITDMLAKDPSAATDSTASDHPIHQDGEDHKGSGSSGGIQLRAEAKDFHATPGPAIPQNVGDLGTPASKEELKARAAELNKE